MHQSREKDRQSWAGQEKLNIEESEDELDEMKGWILPNQLEVALVDIDGTLIQKGIFKEELAEALIHFDQVIPFTQRCNFIQQQALSNEAYNSDNSRNFDLYRFTTEYVIQKLQEKNINVVAVSTSMDSFFELNPGEYALTKLIPFENEYVDALSKAGATKAASIPKGYQQELDDIANKLFGHTCNNSEEYSLVTKAISKDKKAQFLHLTTWIKKNNPLCAIHFTVIDDSQENLIEIQQVQATQEEKSSMEEDSEKIQEEKEKLPDHSKKEIDNCHQLTIIHALPEKRADDYLKEFVLRQIRQYIENLYAQFIIDRRQNNLEMSNTLAFIIAKYRYIFNNHLYTRYNNEEFNSYMRDEFLSLGIATNENFIFLAKERIEEILTQLIIQDSKGLFNEILRIYIYEKLAYDKIDFTSKSFYQNLNKLAWFSQEKVVKSYGVNDFLKDVENYINYIATLSHEEYEQHQKDFSPKVQEFSFLAQLQKQDNYHQVKIKLIFNLLRHIQRIFNYHYSEKFFQVFWSGKSVIQTETELEKFFFEAKVAIKQSLVRLIHEYQVKSINDLEEYNKERSFLLPNKKSDVPAMLEEWKNQLSRSTRHESKVSYKK